MQVIGDVAVHVNERLAEEHSEVEDARRALSRFAFHGQHVEQLGAGVDHRLGRVLVDGTGLRALYGDVRGMCVEGGHAVYDRCAGRHATLRGGAPELLQP